MSPLLVLRFRGAYTTGVTGRERVLCAMRGGEPDRVPRALAIYAVETERFVTPGLLELLGGEAVDVQFIRFPLSTDDEEFRRRAYPNRADTRLGSSFQIATYRRWRYRPDSSRRPNPLASARSVRDIGRFRFPSGSGEAALEGLRSQVRALHDRGLAAGGSLPHLGGELFESAWRLRGLERFLLDLAERPELAAALLDRLTELALRSARLLTRSGVDVLCLGDDVGMPGGMMVSPACWRAFFMSRMRRIVDAARDERPEVTVLYHSDGCYEPIVADLVSIGVDAINPVQPEHMDAPRIRGSNGGRPALWGMVGSQGSLSSSDPDVMEREVRRVLDTVGRRAVILCPAYDLDEPDTRAENVAAFLRAASRA